MAWPGGVRTGKWYPNKEASYNHFKEIWSKHYKRFPDHYMAKKWTGNDNPERWLKIVKSVYYK